MSVVAVAWGLVRGPARFVLMAATLLASIAAARAQHSVDAAEFLENLSERTIAQLTDASASPEEKERRFRALVKEGFDIRAIGRFVLGRYWRGASKAERRDFLAAFEDMLVHRSLPLFADYSGARLKVELVRPLADQQDLVNVTTAVERREGEPLHVDWRIGKVDDQFKILDVVAEGVSIAVTLRSEYGSVLKQNGGDVSDLAARLREKSTTL